MLLCLLLLLGYCSGLEKQQQTQPNIVFISIDDLNDWVGFLGYEQVKTPHMDRLAARGFSFSNAHCPAPVCGPSRTAILSGMRPVTSGIYDNNIKFSRDLPQVVSLPEHFKNNGYQVYGIGKLFHGSTANVPSTAFDVYGGKLGSAAPFTSSDLQISKQNPYHEISKLGKTFKLPLNGMPADRYWNRANTFDWGPVDLPDSLFSDRQSVDWSIDKLHKIKDQPFLLTLGFERPHQPLFNPKRFHDMYPLNEVELPKTPANDLRDLPQRAKQLALYPKTSGKHETVVKYGQWENAVASYLASVSFVDELVGDLVKALETLKLNNNTWIVLWSDHGWHLGEKSHWGKATGWYRSTRVPFLIIPPAGSTDYNKAIEIKNMVNLLDLAPTLADIAGIPKKTSWEGRSLMPLLREEASDWEEVSLTTFSIGSHTISTPDWQLISYFDGSFELYDLVNDPNQFKNIADLPESKIVVEQLKKHIPEEPHWNYFIRYGDYKSLIPKNGSIKIFDQMLEGKNDKDMAGALPGLVKKIESYIERYSPQEKKFIIAALE
ncbi:MAG TPA: sulfatase [Flavobacteriaceae bacterium]|nr:sulfatase [Flavobacteriaceae bacterium]